MSEILDDKTDAEIEKIYNRATVEDLQNMLFQESNITRRRLLRKVLRTKSIHNSENSKPPEPYSRKPSEDIDIKKIGSTVSFTGKTNKNKIEFKPPDVEADEEEFLGKLNQLKKKLDDTVDLASRRQLRKDIQELEEKKINVNLQGNTSTDPMMTNDNDNIDERLSNVKSNRVPNDDLNNFTKKEDKRYTNQADDILSTDKIRSSLNTIETKQSSVPFVKSNIKAFPNQIKPENNRDKQPLNSADVQQASVLPVKSNIKAFSSQIKPKDNREKQSLDSPDARQSEVPPVKHDIKTSASQIKSENKIEKSAVNRKPETSYNRAIQKSPSQKSFNVLDSSIPKKSIAETPKTPVKTNLSRVASAREIFEKPSNSGAPKKLQNSKPMSDKEINDILNSLKAEGVMTEIGRGNQSDRSKLAVPEPRTRKTSATGIIKMIPQMKKRAQTARSSVQAMKEHIIAFCQENTKDYENINISNYSKCWADGLAFCALIHHFYPNSFDYKALSSTNPLNNLKLAFETAKKYAGIEPLLDPEDMFVLESPDEKCVYTYVQFMYNALKQHPRNMFKRNENPSV